MAKIKREPLASAPSAGFRRKPFIERAGERIRDRASAPRWLKQLYHNALMLQSGGRGLSCRLPGGETVRALPAHRHLSWNPIEYAAFRASARKGMTALDVGANVGAYSLLLGQWVGPSGAVFAFEPAPDPYDGLAGHVRINGLQSVVHPVRAAIGDREEAMSRLLVADTSGESRLAADGEATEAPIEHVVEMTIDGFCRRQGIQPEFIKIDVEGWELAALRGARETIQSARGGLSLFVEFHPSLWPSVGVSRADLEDELKRQRLAVIPLIDGLDPWSLEGMSVLLAPA